MSKRVPAASPSRQPLQTFVYDDKPVRLFVIATVAWGVVGMGVGLMLALQLAAHRLNLDLPALSFGRLRPVHTNIMVFAFAANASFAAVYYSCQRLLKARLFADWLGRVHFWTWQLVCVAGVVTLAGGLTQGKEYAEMEWPLDLACVAAWIVFAVNVLGTVARRREQQLYVAVWFYLATVIAFGALYVLNNLAIPIGAFKSFSIYAGAQDALVQWWYGRGAVGFMLTAPLLGAMYYFLPKAAGQPLFSYRLAILHFWTLLFIYFWVAPHHLHPTTLPSWALSLGMVFSLMLWMPSWAGVLNGLLTMRGAWHRVAEDPVLKFFVVGLLFFGLSTFEGPLLAIKSVNALSHFTDWTIAHVHGAALGWVGFLTFGMLYWVAPRVFQAPLHSIRLAFLHFWIATLATVLFVMSLWIAGITQGLMWRASDATSGGLEYPDFVQTLVGLAPLYWARVIAGTLYLAGVVLLAWNLLATWRKRPNVYREAVQEVASADPDPVPPDDPVVPLEVQGAPVAGVAMALQRLARLKWHGRWERLPVTFTALTAMALVVAALLEIIPLSVAQRGQVSSASVRPYTPLELAGRDIYLREGCVNCHSQLVRPLVAETERYGAYSKPGEFVYDHPFQWGSRRIGPDLHRYGANRRPHAWHLRHFEDPRSTSPGSIMPRYFWLLEDQLNFETIERRVKAMARLGVPYDLSEWHNASMLARAQADTLAAQVAQQGGPQGMADAEVMALIAYLQRLGSDASPGAAAGGAHGSVKP